MAIGLALLTAVSVGLFAWLLIQIASHAVKRQKEKVAAVTGINLAEMFIFIEPERLWLFHGWPHWWCLLWYF